jgi:hypothetical protein
MGTLEEDPKLNCGNKIVTKVLAALIFSCKRLRLPSLIANACRRIKPIFSGTPWAQSEWNHYFLERMRGQPR